MSGRGILRRTVEISQRPIPTSRDSALKSDARAPGFNGSQLGPPTFRIGEVGRPGPYKATSSEGLMGLARAVRARRFPRGRDIPKNQNEADGKTQNYAKKGMRDTGPQSI